MDENGTYHYSAPGATQPRKPKKNVTKYLKLIALCLLAAVLLLAAGTCFYTVDDKQQAVVTTFGKVTDVTDAGVHFMLPFGIQQVEKVDVNVYQKIELGYSTGKGSNYNVTEGSPTARRTFRCRSGTWSPAFSTSMRSV